MEAAWAIKSYQFLQQIALIHAKNNLLIWCSLVQCSKQRYVWQEPEWAPPCCCPCWNCDSVLLFHHSLEFLGGQIFYKTSHMFQMRQAYTPIQMIDDAVGQTHNQPAWHAPSWWYCKSAHNREQYHGICHSSTSSTQHPSTLEKKCAPKVNMM